MFKVYQVFTPVGPEAMWRSVNKWWLSVHSVFASKKFLTL